MPLLRDADLLGRWAAGTVAALERHRAEIDRINVFPVPDSDTGTNLLLTMRSAADALRRGRREGVPADDPASCAVALARGALVGARGNSGVLLSQVLRGFAEALADGEGPLVAGALDRADRLAAAAVARPREGTLLTVLSAAAKAAAGCSSDDDGEVASTAADAAYTALRETTGQLAELARAGVVDAGGLGLLVVLDALVEALTGVAPAARPQLPDRARGTAPAPRGRDALTTERESGSTDHEYEVMYLLEGSDDARVAELRGGLLAVGDSVAIVGDGTPGGTGLWNVHVHCTDIGAAIEAGIGAGRPRRITVMRFAEQGAPAGADPTGRFTRGRAVLFVTTGPGAAELARETGADVLEVSARHAVPAEEVAAALAGTRARHVAVLACDGELTAVAERAAATARESGQEVVVVPMTSVPQGLAALAVHDPDRRAGDDVVAMAEAAAGTRTGGLVVAESEALTFVGPCAPGEVLGLSEGEVVLIAPDLTVGALWLAHRMLTPGGELVTALLGAEADEELGTRLAEDLRRTHPEVDVAVFRGGQTDFPLVLGVE
ncbi:MAG: DAK2 domain-containing protein [Pseudonocardia sp.]|nr:DAK2 domain-containing protein [Pseudonocardia sp.]